MLRVRSLTVQKKGREQRQGGTEIFPNGCHGGYARWKRRPSQPSPVLPRVGPTAFSSAQGWTHGLLQSSPGLDPQPSPVLPRVGPTAFSSAQGWTHCLLQYSTRMLCARSLVIVASLLGAPIGTCSGSEPTRTHTGIQMGCWYHSLMA